MIDCKLYKNYYPIETEDRKEMFIENNILEIIRFLRMKQHYYTSIKMVRTEEYIRDLRKEISFGGNIKWKMMKQ